MAATFALLLLLLSAYALLPRAYQELQRRRLLRLCRRHRLVAITFDDGPGRQLTPIVLDRLAAAGVSATFFVLGRAADEHRELIARMLREGHEVGSHGEHHVDHLRTLPWRGVRDTATATARLRRLLGDRRISFRPPHGRLNLLSFAHALWQRHAIAAWTHDGFDTRLHVDVPPAVTANSLRYAGGGVMLLHDFDRTIPVPTARVLARLDAILELRREGYRFVRFQDLVALLHGRSLPATVAPAAVVAPTATAAPAVPPKAPTTRRRRSVRRSA